MKYNVTMPLTGSVTLEVDIEVDEDDSPDYEPTNEELFSAFYDKWSKSNQDEVCKNSLIWEFTEEVVTGNCFNGMMNEMKFERLDD